MASGREDAVTRKKGKLGEVIEDITFLGEPSSSQVFRWVVIPVVVLQLVLTSFDHLDTAAQHC